MSTHGQANGGWITEPVFGIGLHSGERSTVADTSGEVILVRRRQTHAPLRVDVVEIESMVDTIRAYNQHPEGHAIINEPGPELIIVASNIQVHEE